MGSLTARGVQTAKPGRHTDGRGLMLVVKPSGARSWVLRYQINGWRRDMGLGSWPEVTLSMARERALAARRQIVAGANPIDEKRKNKKLTFKDAASAFIAGKEAGWKNAKHAAQWASTLETYAYPSMGHLDVRIISTQHVRTVLMPIWNAKPETASRVRQRIEAILDYAKTIGARDGDNPARWRGHLDKVLAQPSKIRPIVHHAALDWKLLPDLIKQLADNPTAGARALLFTIFTAARSGEVRGATWSEIDLHAGVWMIPAIRMKARKEHRVPITDAAVRCLGKPQSADRLVFTSDMSLGKPLSDMTLSAVLKRLKYEGVTVHGFRSSFRDWAGETSAFPKEVIEAALAHRLRDKAEAAYARGDLFTKRRSLMEAWSEFLQWIPPIMTRRKSSESWEV